MRFAYRRFFRRLFHGAAISSVICIRAAFGAESIPFVGCHGDTQGEIAPTPMGPDKSIDASPAIARQLAFYQGPFDFGIVGPRGWHCYASRGSSASSLEIYPGDHAEYPKYIILISTTPGDTVWMITVAAKYENRLFPAQAKPFVDDYLEMLRSDMIDGIADKEALQLKQESGPFLTDTVNYEADDIVRFTTPPNTEGFGTSTVTSMKKSDEPIYGISRLYDGGRKRGKTPGGQAAQRDATSL